MEEKKLEKITAILARSRNTVVVTGAGISTEAGIPDFRGEKGIYRTLGEDRVMKVLNINTFRKNPREFYEFYRKHFTFPAVEPSFAHRILAEMEKRGLIKAIVTQNIDNLHQRAGSKRVIPVHGTADSYYCTRIGCNGNFDGDYVNRFPDVVPTCAQCGSILKPDVVLFGEPIQNHRYARETILQASVLVVIGSSLTVYPLAGFVGEFGAAARDLIIINKGPTALDYAAVVKLDTNNTGQMLKEIAMCLT